MQRRRIDNSTGGAISDISLIMKAAVFAAHKHRNQKRKGKSQRPYIGHCLEVAEMISRIGGVDDPNVLAAAILHDTDEDTDTTCEELLAEFGPVIDSLVAEVTDDKTLDSAVRKQRQIDSAPHKSAGAKLIKLADKISNVREIASDPPVSWTESRRQDYFRWAEAVVTGLGASNAALEKEFAATLAHAMKIERGTPL
jgi:guanosine-3',5'-bis(diphosphate) 3'-pyrophosphohydrolase